MSSFASPVFCQLQFLVETLAKKNYEAHSAEISELTELYGLDAQVHTVACLLNELDLEPFLQEGAQQTPVLSGEKALKLQLAVDQIERLWKRDARMFGATMRDALEAASRRTQEPEQGSNKQQQQRPLGPAPVKAVRVEVLCRKALKLRTVQQIKLGVGLVTSSTQAVSEEGAKFLAAILFGLSDASDLGEVDAATLDDVVWILRSHPLFRDDDTGLEGSCMVALRTALPKPFTEVGLAPLLLDDSMCVDVLAPVLDGGAVGPNWGSDAVAAVLGIDGVMLDMGPSCTASSETLKGVLEPLLQGRKAKLADGDVASVLGMMARTQAGFVEEAKSKASNEVAVAELQQEFAKLSTNSGGASSGKGGGKSGKGKRGGGGGGSSSGGGGGGGANGWDVGIFVHVAKELCEGAIDADNVIRLFRSSCPELDVHSLSAAGFQLIVRAYKLMKGGKPMPGLLLVQRGADGQVELWENKQTQMALLSFAVRAAADTCTFALGKGDPDSRQVKPPEGVARSDNLAWETVDVVATLDALAGSGFYNQVKELFEEAVSRYAEVLLLALLQIDSPFDTLREETYAALLPKFLLSVSQKEEPVAAKAATVKLVWETNHYVLLRALVAMFARDAMFLGFVVDTVLELPDGLTKLLNLPMPRLVFDAACFAARRQPPALDFERWLQDKMVAAQKEGPKALQLFVRSLIFVLQLKTSPQHQQAAGIALNLQELKAMAGCAQALVPLASSLPMEGQLELRKTLDAALEGLRVLSSAGGGNDGGQANFVEKQANANLQTIYKSSKAPAEIAMMFSRLKNSDKQMDRDVFNCMVHNLLDEYRFLHRYPNKELVTTGVIFGVLIQHDLVSGMALGIALRYVLEALRKPGQSSMCLFGMVALAHFKGRLVEWPQTAAQIVKLPSVREQRPELVAELENQLNQSAAGNKFPVAEGPKATMPEPKATVGAGPITAAAARNTSSKSLPLRGAEQGDEVVALVARLDELIGGPRDLGDSLQPPSSEVEDKITFVINNLTQRNMVEKVAQAKEVIKPEYHKWIAFYLVAKRVSTQANLHSVYMGFLDKLDDNALLTQVRFRTLHTVRKLLCGSEIVSSTQERSLLKKLGSWLGKLTLAKNRPLLHREVDLKGLLIDGYERGWLIAVVPFAAKVLDGSKGTRVFGPNNPWIMGLLSTLAELYHLADLKLNLKFEIEVLCKNLGVDLKEIRPSNLLASRRKPRFESNPDFNVKHAEVSKLQAPASPGMKRDPAAGGNGGDPKGLEIPDTVIPNLAAYVHVNPSLQLFAHNTQLRRVVPVAVDRAIREIIQPVVERSVTIACITSREMVVKDFAMEPDEKKMRKAAHLMVSNLAGALALVTCKEPLRVSMGNHLRSLLSMATQREDQALVEQVVQVCAAENLELGCMLIEKAATEKAMRDIDEQVESGLAVRRNSREKHNMPYYDMSVLQTGNRYPGALPESLRPSPNPSGLQSHQLHVYEAFQRNPRQPIVPPTRSSMAGAPMPGGGQPKPGGGAVAGGAGGMPKGPGGPKNPLTSNQALEKWRLILGHLDRCVNELSPQRPQPSLSRLPRDHEILTLLREIRNVGAMTQIMQRDEACLMIVQHLFKRLYELPASQEFSMEVQLAVLAAFREVMTKDVLRKSLTEWVIYAPAEHKLNLAVTIGLVKNKLINMPDFDAYLAKLLDMGRQPAAVAFAVEVVQECVLASRCVQISEMLATLDALQKIAVMRNKQGDNAADLQMLLDNVRLLASDKRAMGHMQPRMQQQQQMQQPQPQPQQPAPGLFLRSNDSTGLRQQVAQLLHAWIQICQRPDGGAHEAVHRPYLGLLQQQGALKGDDNANRFFRITTELCVESSLTQSVTVNAKNASPQRAGVSRQALSYTAIDAFSKLVVLLVKYAEVRARTSLLSMVLEVIAGVMYREFTLRKQRQVEGQLDQRPYFRLLLNLQQQLIESYEAEGLPEEHTISMLSAFADRYQRLLQPAIMPGFAFAWLELISNRCFMPKLLRSKDGTGWLILERLLVDLLRFLYPFLKDMRLTPSLRLLYKGTLRVLLVLLHDFPEFLCSFHFSLCDVIPASCIQLRNLILSAFPRSMQLHDPFTPNLQVDLLPEVQTPPTIMSNYQQALTDHDVKQMLDQYLQSTDAAPSTVSDLVERFSELDATTGMREFRIPLINSVMLYVGVHVIGQVKTIRAQPQGSSLTLMELLAHDASVVRSLGLLEAVINSIEPEGRYLCLNAIANQLRFPSSHTHFFSCLLLHLFHEAQSDLVREQITRVLLERLIVHRPHPWGLLVTFIELIKNRRYNFWEYRFTQCAPEIHRLFELVARSCANVTAPGQQGAEGGPAAPGLRAAEAN